MVPEAKMGGWMAVRKLSRGPKCLRLGGKRGWYLGGVSYISVMSDGVHEYNAKYHMPSII